MTVEFERPGPVPRICNVEELPDEPELIYGVHFTGEQWRRSIQSVRELSGPCVLDLDAVADLRFQKIGGVRGDVLVTPRRPVGNECVERSSADRICVKVPVRGDGPLDFWSWECRCFPADPDDRRDPPPDPREPECRIAYNLEEHSWTCKSDGCDQCLGVVGVSTGLTSGLLACHCLQLGDLA